MMGSRNHKPLSTGFAVNPFGAVNLSNISVLTSTTAPGTNATYTLNLTNSGTDPDSYNLVISNPDSASTAGLNITSPIALNAGASGIFTLNVTNTAEGTFRVDVTATSVNHPTQFGYVNTTTTGTSTGTPPTPSS